MNMEMPQQANSNLALKSSLGYKPKFEVERWLWELITGRKLDWHKEEEIAPLVFLIIADKWFPNTGVGSWVGSTVNMF